MQDKEKVMDALNLCAGEKKCNPDCPYVGKGCVDALMFDVLSLLKEQEAMTPEAFEAGLKEMFSPIWDYEITVSDLMKGVIQLYKKAVKWE